MKITLSLIAIALSALCANAQSFEDSFKSAFLQSIQGLREVGVEQHGSTWTYPTPFAEMDLCEIVFLPEKGVHALRVTKKVENEGTGIDLAARYDRRIQRVLPTADYSLTTGTSTKYAQDDVRNYAPPADKADVRPTIEMGTVNKGEYSEMQILIIEPKVKKSYTPKV